ncbi:MAG: NAD-dependent DNA ligase LigA [Anaerovoracaceae bacterium]|nr:NAD-dependent DNA ligase LigA [Anaerovoracaceae bacterium]
MEDKRELIKEKIALLNKAGRAYYSESREIMSNYEYDKLYDELAALERETGIIYANSPTQNVGYETVSSLEKERHPSKMLSLDKTKSIGDLAAFAGDRKCLLSWKMDGLTIVLTYRGGELFKAVTRGNGEVGEVVTNNARAFADLPVKINYDGELVIRGEATISYSEFEKINETIPEAAAKYKNPRNLCSGSVRQLDSSVTARRNVMFRAFTLVSADPSPGFSNSREAQQLWLRGQGFDIVGYKVVTAENMAEAVAEFEKEIAGNDMPSDGLVLTYDDIEYGRSLGQTAKYPRDSIAFKWRDEIRETELLRIEWNASRTGLINPVAVFEPVELEGTTVSRASVHNVSIMKELELGAGDTVTVYKANMIIPQIEDNLTRSGTEVPPASCPVCGAKTEIRGETGVETLYCPNPGCPAKKIKSFTLFVSRDAMNIEGLSEQTLEKLIGLGFVKEPADLFRLDEWRESIESLEGFGERSFENLRSSVENARHTTAARLLYSLGIPGIGSANAGVISRACGGDFSKIRALTHEQLTSIEGIGDVLASAVTDYFSNAENNRIVDDLLSEVEIGSEGNDSEQTLSGMTFVITGSLEHFENRGQLKEEIQARGGKVAGSVSGNTDFLINNDASSGSSKNRKAGELGVPIITEDEFLERFDVPGRR